MVSMTITNKKSWLTLLVLFVILASSSFAFSKDQPLGNGQDIVTLNKIIETIDDEEKREQFLEKLEAIKKHLVESGKKNDSLNLTKINDGKLESLIRSIVKDEIRSFQRGQKIAKVSKENTKAKKTASYSSQLGNKVKPISVLNKMTKKELEDLCPTAKWDAVFASQYDSVITNPPKEPVDNNDFVIPS